MICGVALVVTVESTSGITELSAQYRYTVHYAYPLRLGVYVHIVGSSG